MATARKKTEDAPEQAEAQAPEAPKEENDRQKRARLTTAAKNQLVENHRDEFNRIAEAQFAAEGLEFKRKLTPEEKAEKELDALLEANPALRDKLASKVGEQHSGELNLTANADSFGTEPVEVEQA